ncbi:MAG: hypothetical protein ACJ77K_17320 [Bacteroidia bacterium]
MKFRKLLALLFLFLSFSALAQEDTHGTIKIQKKGQVYAVFFDNVNNRLIGKDSYGNILDSAVVSFSVQVTIKGVSYKEDVIGTTLSTTLQNRITRVDNGTKLFFTNLKVKTKGQVVDWPKFSSNIGYSYESQEN